jgi:hypothetical protein
MQVRPLPGAPRPRSSMDERLGPNEEDTGSTPVVVANVLEGWQSMVECTGLLNRPTERLPGFESLSLRQFRGRSTVVRARAFQALRRGFESPRPLQNKPRSSTLARTPLFHSDKTGSTPVRGANSDESSMGECASG